MHIEKLLKKPPAFCRTGGGGGQKVTDMSATIWCLFYAFSWLLGISKNMFHISDFLKIKDVYKWFKLYINVDE